MSWRKFAVLVRQLPDDSRTTTLAIDEQRNLPAGKKPKGPLPMRRMTYGDQLLLDVRDLLVQVCYTISAVATAQGGKKPPKPPTPLPRPTDPRPIAKELEITQAHAKFQRLTELAGLSSPN